MNHLQSHPHVQDAYWISTIRSGGAHAETAIRELYLTYKSRVTATLVKLIAQHEEVKVSKEDLLHDSFIVLIRKLEEDAEEPDSLCAYWKGIAKKLFLNTLRRNERIILVSDPEQDYGFLEQQSVEADFIDHEVDSTLDKTFNLLGKRCKEVLLLWITRHTMVDIARQLNLSGDNMARKIKYSCFKKLKNLVKKGHNSTP